MKVNVTRGDETKYDSYIVEVGGVFVDAYDDEVAIVVPDGDGLNLYSLTEGEFVLNESFADGISARRAKEIIDADSAWTDEIEYYPPGTDEVEISIRLPDRS